MGDGSKLVVDPMGRPNLSGYLSRQILNLIREESLCPGDRLPSVRELSRRFAVASPTMRGALGRLQANGVVEIRHGSGVYVRNGQERVMLSNPNRGEIDLDTVRHLLDARILIEPPLAGLAAAGIDSVKVAELESVLDEAGRYIGGDKDEELHRANMAFHLTVAKFSGNPILAQTVESLLEIYSFEQLVIISFYDDRVRDHEEHLEIFRAITGQRSKVACDLMNRHLSGVRDVIEKKRSEGNFEAR